MSDLSRRDQLAGMSVAQLGIAYGRTAERLRAAVEEYQAASGGRRATLACHLAPLVADYAELKAALIVQGVRTCDTCYHAQGDHTDDCETLRADEDAANHGDAEAI